MFHVLRENTESRSLYDLGIGQWNIPSLRMSLGEMLTLNSRFQNVEVERDFPDLGKRIMSLSAHPIHSIAGIPIMILLAAEDITERKSREKERGELLNVTREAKREADEANRTKDLFLATLSHELRTPLTSLMLQSQMLLRSVSGDAKIKRAASAIERAAKMQAQLIEDLLDISRIVTGKLRLEFQAVSLPDVLRGALDTVGAMAESKSVRMEAQIEDVGPVYGDSVRLQQVFWNLLTNAIKFSSEGKRIIITLKALDGNAEIKIIDEGIGIEPQFLPHVFDQFSQGEGQAAKSQRGLGLGLAIVRHVVEMHQGSVRAESAGKNKGAIFTVSLPLMKATSGKGVSETSHLPTLVQSTDKTPLKGVRILVVDDDADIREALILMLDQAGAVVRAAASAQQALEVIKDFAPEELVCDIAMPDEDGYSLLRKIRNLKSETRDIPALALTAYAGEKDRQKILSAGFQMYLAKPVEVDRLTRALLELSKRGHIVH